MKNLHDPFLKQAKYKLKKSHRKDFLNFLGVYKEVFEVFKDSSIGLVLLSSDTIKLVKVCSIPF